MSHISAFICLLAVSVFAGKASAFSDEKSFSSPGKVKTHTAKPVAKLGDLSTEEMQRKQPQSVVKAVSKPQLIGHRGGVIDSTHTENSLAGLEAAYKRGYYMAEIDIRLTKDGQLIILHDPTLTAYYHVNKAAKDLTWEEIRGLKSDRDGSSPILFEDALKYCQGRLQVMLDTKIAGNDPVNFKKIEDLLKKYNLLDKALVIGSNEIRSYFTGKSKTGYSINALKQLQTQSDFNPDRYFLFSHGNEIKEEEVKWAQANNVMVVPSINKYHYRNISFMEGAKRDIENLKKWGVVYYQIDSEFDQWLLK